MIVHETEVELDDPHVKMRTVRVMFAGKDSQYDYQTTMNGTRREIAEYFRGAKLNVLNSEKPEIIRTPHRLEFIDHDGDTVAVILVDAFNAAWEEYLRLRKLAAETGSWIQDIDGQTRPSLLKQARLKAADAYWSENYRVLNSLPKPIEKIREAL